MLGPSSRGGDDVTVPEAVHLAEGAGCELRLLFISQVAVDRTQGSFEPHFPPV